MPRINASTSTEALAQPEEEPPGTTRTQGEEEDEPPDRRPAARNRLFADVPDSCWNDWKWQFRHRITTVEQLANLIPLSPKQQAQIRLVTKRFPFSITPHYLSLADTFNLSDPIMRQAVPSFEEVTLGGVGFVDPLAEREDSVVAGLVHRYPDRVLMVVTNLCAMLCRHCTRKREWHEGGWVRPWEEIEAMLQYIRENEKVRDVIISGGDPLVLATPRLEQILVALRQIKHVEIIRIGTRFPVVLPQRVDDELCSMLSKYGPIWLNTHFNHPREVTPESAQAVDRLLRAGVPVNNQTVLLRGINDSVATQLRLCHELLKAKVRPYYLFQCDEVQGVEHLRTSVDAGIKIIDGMRGHTSGLAIPTYVVDLPGGGGKVPVQPDYLLARKKDSLVFRNYQGNLFEYRDPRGAKRAESERRNGNGRRKDQEQLPLLVN